MKSKQFFLSYSVITNRVIILVYDFIAPFFFFFYKNDVSSLFLSSRTDLIIEKLNKKHILFFHFFKSRSTKNSFENDYSPSKNS